MQLRVDLLGTFRAEADGAPVRIGGRTGMAMLACLLRRGQAVPRESLKALLWPDSGDAQARASLHQALASLRRDPGVAASAISSAGESEIALVAGAVATDAAECVRLAGSGTIADLEAVQTLWRGDFLEGLGPVAPEFDRWAEDERGALRVMREELLVRLCDAQAAAGRTAAMIASAR